MSEIEIGQSQLFKMYQRCLELNPQLRPSTTQSV